ncbi:alpha-2-macroglobulin receptor-associated protein [Neocloeon triangulifer]|uniref:alpha-2-macroglobulin receptor-associated protein n=1 Tax=Neocloeon triangulifer TaxID=2078957 RepID=UPI00286FADCA|nr:alpha-2-macroglobulin receptor-associated protein [Neocloeon triangulifer]
MKRMNGIHCALHLLFLLVLFSSVVECGNNKYSKEANMNYEKEAKLDLSYFRNLQSPFRMAKVNILWSKAQKRLTESKLKSLFSELKIHDKEELTFKKMKSDGGDKEGLKEAEMRKKLIGIMSTYGLLEHFEDVNDPKKLKTPDNHPAFNEAGDEHLNKLVFRDKKLNKLWMKAEKSGFTTAELKTLHEEFTHHQDKIDQYHGLLSDIEQGNVANSLDEENTGFNDIEQVEEKEKKYSGQAKKLKAHHQEIRDGYDRLHRLAAQGPDNKEFVEPKVQGLWRIAAQSNFTTHELESLRVELLHYENRLLKLRHLQVEAEIHKDRLKSEMDGKMSEEALTQMDKIKKQVRKAEKLHYDLESRILSRHNEL